MQAIHWLEADPAPGRAELGGKGYGLATLAGAGMPVPAGFVVTVEACHALYAEDESASHVLREIASAWAALSPDGEPVAVRSSAVDEDSEQASFAGMHETVLNVTDRDGLLDAIETCIVSAEGAAASAYREQRGTSNGERPAIAVVVQRMVSPEAAGVAFSIDPVSGNDESVVIEAVEGNAERLVGGEVTGYRVEVSREDQAIQTADDGALALLGEGGARAIAKLAVEAEELFGAPQDIEWAWIDGDAYILQSRAVTTAPPAGEPDAQQGWVSEFDTQTDEETVWTSANVQEVLPGLLTPLSMSIYRESSRVGYNVGFQKLGMLASDEWQPFMGTFYNRAFLNLSTTRMLADRGIGTSAESVDEQYLAGERGTGGEREPLSQRLRFKARSALPLLRMTLQLPAAADRMDRSTRELEQEMHALDPSALSNDELMEHLDRVLRHGASIFATHLQVSGTALFGFEATRKLVQGVLGEETDGRMPTLFGGMRNVESAAIGQDLWNLAVVAKNEGIADRLAQEGFDPGDPALPDGWRAAWRQFVQRHGHRGMNEMEASARSWRLYPEQVLSVIRSYLELPEEHAPPAITDRQERERLRLTAKIASQLNPVKRRVFRKVLSDAQGWVALRERTKSVIVRAARIPDHFLPEFQRRLVAQGTIDGEDDVFFLARGEIETALTVEGEHHLQDAVARRRAEYERNSRVRLPERFTGHPVPLPPDTQDEHATVLYGTPVSAGIVTAKARVVLDPEAESGLQPGEILVAPVTDAGWTPLFALAGGLVVDLGSALSHGSTVAREYGLPAVVNVHNGTRAIRTGDLVTVNGSAGTVSIAAPDEAEG